MKVIFWIGKSSILGSAIRMFKHRGVSHSEILFTDNVSGTSDRDKGGVVLYSIPKLDPTEWVAIDIPCTIAQEAIMREFFISELGCGYDWKGILFAQMLPWGRESKDKWFCSEICTAALKLAYPHTFSDITPCEVDPAELLKLITARSSDMAMETI